MEQTLGQIAFEAYVASKGNIAYDGTQIPNWEELMPEIREAWEASARAVKFQLILLEIIDG